MQSNKKDVLKVIENNKVLKIKDTDLLHLQFNIAILIKKK